MPKYILKPDRDEDFYVYWSTIVEAPVGWGDRSTMAGEFPGDEMADDRFERADCTGSSSHQGWYGWGETLVYDQQGFVGHSQIRELCERIQLGRSVADLIEPFEDDEPYDGDADA